MGGGGRAVPYKGLQLLRRSPKTHWEQIGPATQGLSDHSYYDSFTIFFLL